MADQRSSTLDDAATARPSLGEEVLGSLLVASHHLHADDLPAAVAEHARRLGALDAVMYLVDLEQRVLVPMGADPATVDEESLDIDATLAGRAFRAQTLVEGEAGASERRLWIPLLDGTERLGVLAVALAAVDPLTEQRFRWLASLVAELVITKSAYGDAVWLTRRRREMNLASELRWAMLPPLTFTSRYVEIAGVVEPAYDVAGDSFDYAVNGRTAHLAIFDAMGHGLEASRMANLAVGGHRHGRRHGLSLVETFMSIDETIAGSFGPEHFVTGQLATLDLTTGTLAVAGGGHPWPLLLRGTAVVGELVGELCTPMGLGRPPVVSETQLEPGDRVVFYTDGVVEARSPAGEEFGLARLGDLVGRAAAAQEIPAETMRRLTHSVLAHEAGQLRDDATLLLVGWRGPMAAG